VEVADEARVKVRLGAGVHVAGAAKEQLAPEQRFVGEGFLVGGMGDELHVFMGLAGTGHLAAVVEGDAVHLGQATPGRLEVREGEPGLLGLEGAGDDEVVTRDDGVLVQ
jgi:hypothetical protein